MDLAVVNPRVLYGYASYGAAATADSTASGYSATNALALDRASTWRSASSAAQRLKIHSGAAFAPTGLGICAGNYSVWGTTKLQYSDDGSTWTTLLTLTGLPSVDESQDYFATLSGAPSKTWWALRWDGPSAAPELALFYLGTLVTLAETVTYPVRDEYVFGVDSKESEGHVIKAERTARRRARFPNNFEDCGVAVRNQIDAVVVSEDGPLRPFFWVPMDESGSSTAGRAYLVRYTGIVWGADRLFTDPYNVSFPLLEEV